MAQVSRIKVLMGMCCISACLKYAYSQASTTSNPEQSCSDLPDIENGISFLVNTSDPSTGAFVICNFGFKTTTNFIYCLSTGLWEKAACTEIDCGPVPEVENGYVQQVDLSNASYGGVAIVICNTGYTPLVEQLICLETGQWEDLELYAACIIIDCEKVPDIENGQVVLDQPSNSSYGAVALVMCDIGHEALAAELMCLESGMWEDEDLFALCTAIDCGTVPGVEHGHIVLDDLSNSSYGSIAHVVCDSGHVAFVELLSCLETGQWEDWESFAGCNAIECDKKPNVTNGEVSLDDGDNTYGALGYIQCNVGYNSTSLNITCTENGTWEYAACSIIDCGLTPNISNGAIVLNDGSNSTFAAVAWVTCFSGFSSTIDAITCIESGAWDSIAICEPIDCGQPLNISDGFLELHNKDNASVGALASVVCDSGYISNVTTVSCTDSGLWGGNVTCEPVECGTPQPVPHAQVELLSHGTTTYGAEARVLCDVGYMTNITFTRCEDTGEWSYTSPCTRIDCGPLPTIDNGVLTLQDVSNTTYGASATVDCDTGYRADTDKVNCTDTGLWEDWEEFVTCRTVDCGPVPSFTNGIAVLNEKDDTYYEATATVVCDDGYIVNSSDILRCTVSGSWDDAVCVLNECSPNPLIENGVMSVPDGAPTVGIVSMVTCDSGYFGNVDVIECLPTGEWEVAICSNTDCGEVPGIENGFIIIAEGNMTTYGSIADVICDEGYVSSLPTIECQIDGTWQNDARCTGYGLGAVTIETGEEKADDQHLTYLKCAFSVFVGLTYRIKWYYNGYEFHDTGIIPWQEATIFRFSDEDLFDTSNVPILGSKISCMASVHDGIGAELENRTSVDFVPMEISATELTMIRGQAATLSVYLNIPFGCPLTSSECSLSFLLYDPDDNYECDDSTIAVVSTDTCGGKVLITNAASTSFTGTIINITITTKNNRFYRLRSYFSPMIKMSAIGNSKSVWNQKLTDLTVRVNENDLTKYRGCYAFVDPYMYTFDRRYYSNQLIEEFVMFRHKTLPIEVQTMTAPCNWNRATCSCSVTVRAGGDVFTINHCGGHMTGYLSHNDGILRVYRWFSCYYQIVLPTGMQVYVYIMPYFEYTMNVYIVPAQSDFNQSDGLCGNYNGESDDDTFLRGTNTPSSVEGNQGSGWWWWWSDYFYPHDFAYSWGLQTTQRQDESLLNPDVYENVESWAEDKKLCVCPNLPNEEIPESLCSADEEATCMGSLWWRYGTLVTPSSVQKRHAVMDNMPTHLSSDTTRKRLKIMTQKWEENRQLYGHHILKRQVANTTVISVDEGKAICEEQLNSTCNAYSKKEDVKDIADPNDNLDNCGQDVAIDGSTEWTQPHCDAYTQKVTSELEKDIEFAEDNEELTQNINDNACPGNCSGNGDCVKKICECYEGFGTNQCFLELSVPPLLEEYGDEGLCDVSTGSTCDYILIVGNGFIEEAWCNVSMYMAETDGQFLLIRHFARPCVYANFNEVYAQTFDIDENVRRRRREVGNSDAALASMIGISVSNDGMNYGETKYVVVLDTTCQQTDVNTSETSVVTLKSGYCYISGTCYTEGTFRTNSICDVCDTSTDAFVWTNVCVSGLDAADDTDRLAIIIGSVFGSVLIIAVITITGIFLLKKSKENNTPAPSMPSNIQRWFSKKSSMQPNVLTQSDSLLRPKRKMSVGIAGVADFGEEHC